MPERMNTSNPAKDKRNKTMAMMRANGDTFEEIGKEVGLSKAQAYQVLSKKEAKEIIERESNRLMEALPDITANSITQIKTAQSIHNAIRDNSPLPGTFTKTIPTKDGSEIVPDVALAIKYSEMAAKREKDILQAMGILATPNQSTIVQNIYNDNRQIGLDQSVIKALGGFLQPTTNKEDHSNPPYKTIQNDSTHTISNTTPELHNEQQQSDTAGIHNSGTGNNTAQSNNDNLTDASQTCPDNSDKGGNIYSYPTHTIEAEFEEIKTLGGNGATFPTA